jgi:hypothetical protein
MSTGKEIFMDILSADLDGLSDKEREYRQSVITAHSILMEDLYPMLEQAKSEGKKIHISDDDMYEIKVSLV